MAVRRLSSVTSATSAPLSPPAPPILHKHARAAHAQYPARSAVSDQQVAWSNAFPSYDPTIFEHPAVTANDCTVKEGGWADPSDCRSVAGIRDRRSHAYAQLQPGHDEPLRMQFDARGRPLNPFGRTGMAGRGLLGKWGPNYAADPIVTRWAMVPADEGDADEDDGSSSGSTRARRLRRALQMVAIQRRDTGEWAIPGGMVDAGEEVSATLRREFEEEAANCDCTTTSTRTHSSDSSTSSSDSSSSDSSTSGSSSSTSGSGGEQMRTLLAELFDTRRGYVRRVYRGYVDDPRNTDHAWMETTAVHYHCDAALGAALGRLGLRAGDDAAAVRWVAVREGDPIFDGLYASHKQMVLAAAAGLRGAQGEQYAPDVQT